MPSRVMLLALCMHEHFNLIFWTLDLQLSGCVTYAFCFLARSCGYIRDRQAAWTSSVMSSTTPSNTYRGPRNAGLCHDIIHRLPVKACGSAVNLSAGYERNPAARRLDTARGLLQAPVHAQPTRAISGGRFTDDRECIYCHDRLSVVVLRTDIDLEPCIPWVFSPWGPAPTRRIRPRKLFS